MMVDTSYAFDLDTKIEDDHSVRILLSMKHARYSLSMTKGSNALMSSSSCKISCCLLCKRGVPFILQRSPTWSSIMRVVFFTLKNIRPDREYFNLRTDVYAFMLSHWDKLCISKTPTQNWKKQIQDMLSHSKSLFESGSGLFKQNGFWRLKPNTDPWTMQKQRREKTKWGEKRSDEDSENDTLVPQKKRKTYKSAADFLVPRVVENKNLVGHFLNLKTEIESMRERMRWFREELNQSVCEVPVQPMEQESAQVPVQLMEQDSAQSIPCSPLTHSSDDYPSVTQLWPNPLLSVLSSNAMGPLQVVPEGQTNVA